MSVPASGLREELWAGAPRIVVLDYGGVLAADGFSPVSPRAAGVLAELARRGVRLILASNTAPSQPRGVRTDQLRAAGVDWCVDVVLESGGLGCGKPDPRFFDRALDEIHRLVPLGEAHDAVWVEDEDRRGIVPAIQYGLRAVWVSARRDVRLTAIPAVRQIAEIGLLPQALGFVAPSPAKADA